MTFKHKMAAALFLASCLSAPGSAATFLFDLSGAGVSGHIALTYVTNSNTGGPLDSSPNTVDPVGSFIVTDATGTFNHSIYGLSTTITGIVPSNPANPHATNLKAPASFGHYIVANGVPGPEGLAPGFSYDNLFYPGGAPAVASDYDGAGGLVDIYGLVFTTSSGVAINFWSNGDFGAGADYGVGLTDGVDVLYYTPGGVSLQAVPEPAAWALMVAGFGLVGASMRRREKAAVRFV